MFFGYNKARRSGLSGKRFPAPILSSKSHKNPGLTVGQRWRRYRFPGAMPGHSARYNELRHRSDLRKPAGLLLTLALATQGCSYVNSLWGSGDDTDLDDVANANEGEPLPPPLANVAISYRRPGDALARATVIKYFGAEVIANHQRDASHTESVVRFDGGVPIWEFKADEGTFGSITGVGAAKYTLKSIEYAKVPTHFTQILPEEGPPEPLDRDRKS